MSSNYAGVDSFSASLSLMTDGDSPSAQLFRLPLERLLDNDTNLAARATAVEGRATDLEGRATDLEGRATDLEGRATDLEGRADVLEAANAVSSVTALATTTASTTTRTLATRTLVAGEAVAGTCFRYSATIQVARGASAGACSLSLQVLVGAAMTTIVIPIDTTLSFLGSVFIEGEITFHSAPSASAAVTASIRGIERVQSGAQTTIMNVPSLTATRATNAPLTLSVTAEMSAAVSGLSFTPVSAYIERVRA